MANQLPFVMPDPFSFKKRVFAHYFYPFPLSIGNQPAASDYYNTQYLAPGGENGTHKAYGGFLRSRPLPVPPGSPTAYALLNMQREVQMAIARGITGFTFDILNLADAISPTGHLAMMLQAAQAVDPRFWIVPMLDMSSMVGLTQAQAVQLIASFTHPSFARIPDGRLLVSAFNASQPLTFWQIIIQSLNKQNVNVAFIPVILGNPGSVGTLSPISLGLGGWGTATPASAAAIANYMNPIMTQQFRPKSEVFWEASGSDTFRAGWASAIRDNSQYCQIVTWSDFSESGQVQPYTDATLATNIGTAFYDLTAYYATWFMSGVQPAITSDRIYWFYRRMASSASHPNQTDGFKVVSSTEVQIIEALAFLTDPGTILINGAPTSCRPGITSVKAPTAPGQPSFALQRNGSNVFQATGPVTIYGSGGSPAGTLDLSYWCGSFP
jgi:hypothetical protein